MSVSPERAAAERDLERFESLMVDRVNGYVTSQTIDEFYRLRDELLGKIASPDAELVRVLRACEAALGEVYRLYSERGGNVWSNDHYKLLANHKDCGPMINKVRDALAEAERILKEHR